MRYTIRFCLKSTNNQKRKRENTRKYGNNDLGKLIVFIPKISKPESYELKIVSQYTENTIRKASREIVFEQEHFFKLRSIRFKVRKSKRAKLEIAQNN